MGNSQTRVETSHSSEERQYETLKLDLVDKYPIKISIEQSLQLFGIFNGKRTLTWSDIIKKGSQLNFRKCVDCKIEVTKLYNMQKDLEEWIRYEKVSLDDYSDLGPWSPNPFLHFQCNIGDLILKRTSIQPHHLVKGGVQFDILWERYGLTPELMALLKYTPEDWIELGIQAKHLEQFNETQWQAVFGNLRRKDVLVYVRQK